MTTATARTRANPTTPDPAQTTDERSPTQLHDVINSNDQIKSKTNSQSKNKGKSQIKSKCTSNPNDQAHQCIARSDGVVRALRARTGDQHQQTFKIVSEGF